MAPKKAGKKAAKKPVKETKKDKALKLISSALVYGVQHDMVDLERSTKVMSAVTVEELITVVKSLKSKESITATAQGRKAEDWSNGVDQITAKHARLLFQTLDKEEKGTIDLNGFLSKAVKKIKVKKTTRGPTEKEKEVAKRNKIYAEMDWTSWDAIVATWPQYIQMAESKQGKKATNVVSIEEFDLRKPFTQGEYLVDGGHLLIEANKKYSLMGASGSGKSVLFETIASGEIKGFPKHLQVYHMTEIEVSPDAESLIDTVVHANVYRNNLLECQSELQKRIDADPAPAADAMERLKFNLKQVQNRLAMIRSEYAVEEAAKMLRVLGFDDIAQQKSTNSLSGGLRMRVALAAAFFVEADILLLDEPTNHLDFPSLLWLENKLRSYRKTFIVVCHDRNILENVCGAVILIRDQELKYYNMTYKDYEKKREKEDKKYAQEVDKFLARYRNVDPSSPLARQKKIKQDWLDNYQAEIVRRAGQFTFPPPSDLVPENEDAEVEGIEQKDISIINVQDVRFSYDPLTLPFIFDTPININIKLGTRMGVMGPNGAGKSTFLKLLTKRLMAVDGKIKHHKKARVAYFAQHHSAEMDLNMTPLEYMRSCFPDEKDAQLKRHLNKVGLVDGKAETRMTGLSQGYRSCALFAKITYVCPHLLIMDEPTNFLDIETVDALIAATNKYTGALLLVSHSRLFLKKCADTYLSIVPGQFNVYPDLSSCEQATYTFIKDLEAGEKVKMGSSNLAQHGANAEYGGASEQAAA
jgi:ATP-binding cassette subfamily F protein 3